MKKIYVSVAIIVMLLAYSFLNGNPDQPTNPTIAQSTGQSDTTVNSSTSAPTINPNQTTQPTSSGQYKNGTYTGSVANAHWGYVQIRATVSSGKLTNVEFMEYPNDRDRSERINERAMPLLKSEAIQAQNANVDIVTGATDTSEAFIESLKSALEKA